MSPSAIDLLLRRRSVLARDLVPPGPQPEEMRTILRAGLRVPDHGRAEPWRIQVLDKPAQRALGDFSAELYRREHPEAAAVVVDLERQRPQRSPALLVIAFRPNEKKLAKVPEVEQLLSTGAVCQNILVAVQALGYSAQWLTDWPAYHAEIRRYLGHGEDTRIVGFVHIGTAASPPNERPRPDFDAIVSQWRPPSRDRRTGRKVSD